MEYIENVVDDNIFGNGIVKNNGMVIFVKGAISGEKIKYKIVKEEKRYCVGSLIDILNASSYRELVSCPYYEKCGGCTLLHVNNSYEDNIKYNFIKNMFTDYKVNNIVSNDDMNYRNKITLHVKNGKLGFYKNLSNELIEIDKCLLADVKINKVIEYIKLLDLSKVNSVMIRSSFTTGEVMIKFDGFTNTSTLYDIADSIYVNDSLVYGKNYITEVINEIKYSIYPDSFFQVNTKMMIKLYDIVKKYALTGDKLLDLYCGTGTIGIYLKDNYKYILGIEINEDSISNALINKELNNIDNIDFKCMDCKDIEEDYFDTVIVDPPRSGMNKNTINFLNKMKSSKIVYVSCNPVTLKRDLNLLDKNYIVKEISVVNMFRNTSHVESVILLKGID